MGSKPSKEPLRPSGPSEPDQFKEELLSASQDTLDDALKFPGSLKGLQGVLANIAIIDKRLVAFIQRENKQLDKGSKGLLEAYSAATNTALEAGLSLKEALVKVLVETGRIQESLRHEEAIGVRLLKQVKTSNLRIPDEIFTKLIEARAAYTNVAQKCGDFQRDILSRAGKQASNWILWTVGLCAGVAALGLSVVLAPLALPIIAGAAVVAVASIVMIGIDAHKNYKAVGELKKRIEAAEEFVGEAENAAVRVTAQLLEIKNILVDLNFDAHQVSAAVEDQQAQKLYAIWKTNKSIESLLESFVESVTKAVEAANALIKQARKSEGIIQEQYLHVLGKGA